jgi:glycosidase
MIAAMKYWVTNTDIDGFRCDVAWNVPASFWNKCIPQLRSMKSMFMLAEGDSAYLPKSGFDAVYPWQMFHTMIKVAKGKASALSIDSAKAFRDAMYPPGTIQMYFTSNHDENTWNESDYGKFPGPIHEPFAVLTQTMADGVPLIYSGQEEPVLRSIKFFDKDPMEFGKFKRQQFYKTLLDLRNRNAALAVDASFRKVNAGDEKAVYAFVREKDGKKVLVVLNLTDSTQPITIGDDALTGKALNVFKGSVEELNNKEWMIEPWGYRIYEY